MSRLSPGTGANPKERKGRDPEGAAVASNFQLEYLEDLLDILVANYNGTPHSSLGYRTPLEQFDFLASREPGLIRIADAGEVTRLLCARKTCRVLATKSGTQVRINFHNSEYSAEWLKSRRDLFGEYVDAYLEDDYDARFVTVSYRGQILGSLRASPPWHQSPHSLYMRAAIKGLAKKKILSLSSLDDPIAQLCEQAERQPDGKMKVHPAYLEARRVYAHFAEKVDAVTASAAAVGTPEAAPSAGDRRARGPHKTVASSSPASLKSPTTRRKAINTGKMQ